MTSSQRETLAQVRAASTEKLVEIWHDRGRGRTVEAAMDDRWVAMAVLGELLRRNEVERI